MLSPTYEYRFMPPEEIAHFIASHYAQEVYQCYAKLQIGAAQADLWRVLVLQKYGGVYIDIDAHLVWPLHLIVRPEYTELYLLKKNGTITNYFLASIQDNVHLERVIHAIVMNIKENSLRNVYFMTGPGVFNQVLHTTEVNAVSYRCTCHQGNFTNEYFQYIDKPQGKWTKAQKTIDIVKR